MREANDSQNQANVGVIKSNTSGYPGVHYDKRKRRWVARIRFQGKRRWVGSYKTEEEAFLAYLKEKERLCGEFFDIKNYEDLLNKLGYTIVD